MVGGSLREPSSVVEALASIVMYFITEYMNSEQ